MLERWETEAEVVTSAVVVLEPTTGVIRSSHLVVRGTWNLGLKAKSIWKEAEEGVTLEIEVDAVNVTFPTEGQTRNISNWLGEDDYRMVVKKNGAIVEDVADLPGPKEGICLR